MLYAYEKLCKYYHLKFGIKLLKNKSSEVKMIMNIGHICHGKKKEHLEI